MPQTITVPPATTVTIKPPGGNFTFAVTSTTNICFGTATPAGSFPSLENQTFVWQQGSTHSYPIPPEAGARLPYNTSSPGVACTPGGITDNGKVIIVGSGITKRKKSKPKPKPKKAAKRTSAKKAPAKKSAAKKTGSKTAAKRKPAPKKKAPAKKKAAAKKSAGKKTTKKSARKSRR